MSENNAQVGTPFGPIDRDIALEFIDAAGVKHVGDRWVILSYETIAKSKAPGRPGETRYEKKGMRLPLRYYNMQYALLRASGDVRKAIKFVRDKLEQGGKPVYLPELFDDGDIEYTYGKILREAKMEIFGIH